MSCPHCREDARFVDYRPIKTVVSLLGELAYERAYYHCASCKQGWFPTDEQMGIVKKKTPAVREVLSLTGVLESFAEGATDVLPRLSGLRVSPSTVERTTEEVGDDVARRRAAGETFGSQTQWTWNKDARGRTVAYLSGDATGVPQQGPGGAKAEGRMPYVGALFNARPTHKSHPRRRVWERRYVAGLMSLDELSAQLRRECETVNLAEADVVIGLTDGGAGLQDCLTDAVAGIAREVVFILDFYHAAEHLGKFARALHPHDDERRQQQAQDWCHRLKHQGGQAMLGELEALDLSAAPPPVIEEHRTLCGYLRNNLHRTDYPTYVAHGWQIGSGMIESACKTVVGERLKQSGMRWGERGTTAVCQLRALYLSEPALWRDYWSRTACV